MKTRTIAVCLLLTSCSTNNPSAMDQLFYLLKMPVKPDQYGNVVGLISNFTLSSLHTNSVSVSYTINW